MIWKATHLPIRRLHSWQCMSEQKPSHEVEGIVHRSPRQGWVGTDLRKEQDGANRWSPPFSLGNYAVICLCIISYIISPENLKCYYIQLGRTIGYKSDVNLSSLRPGIRLSRSGSSVWTSTLDMGSYPRGRPKTTWSPQERLRRRAHHPLLPSILLANVQSLDNKVYEIRERVTFQRDIRDCNILCFTETWLTLG